MRITVESLPKDEQRQVTVHLFECCTADAESLPVACWPLRMSTMLRSVRYDRSSMAAGLHEPVRNIAGRNLILTG